jgi:hypothetical protein
MADNPFDLEKRKAPDSGATRAPPRVWTAEEAAEKLVGYLEVPPDIWTHIRAGTHIRYYLKGGNFRAGGFVKSNPFDNAPKGAQEKKRYISMHSSMVIRSPGYMNWLVPYEDLERVFIKPDANVLMTHLTIKNAVTSLNENIRKVADFARQLEGRFAALDARLAALEKQR